MVLFSIKKAVTSFFCFFIILSCQQYGVSQDLSLSDRVANYEIDVHFDAISKKLTADQRIEWTNPSDNVVEYLYFHLYYNAFKNSNSTFFSERGFLNILPKDSEGVCSWSWTEIMSLKDEAGNELVSQGDYMQPDDDNTEDQTVWRVKLNNPILPKESAQFAMKWKAKMPKIMPRTGYNKDYHFFAQWFPKLGVYEPAGTRYTKSGAWNCHQYHSSGEFYADFGTYDVRITLPKDFVVSASGLLVDKMEEVETTTWNYQANDVIDFAWTASPHYKIQKSKWKDIDINIITYPNHLNCNDKYFESAKNVLEYMDKHVGPYPYSILTIVDPPIHGIFTGGMEYPTLITSLNFCFLPQGIKSTETLTTHELIHQYFMQMVASNEYEEPWLDEGLTTYYEGRILDHYYGKDISFVDWMGIKIGNGVYNRWEYLSRTNPKIADNMHNSSEFEHGGYSTISYNKTAVWLKTLEGILGIETMDKIMQSYFNKWKFKHPSGNDFIDVVNEVSIAEGGENMDWFFIQTLRSSNICDYQLASISNDEIINPAGFLAGNEECQAGSTKIDDDANTWYTSEVVVHRVGEVQLPNEIKILFDDGEEKLLSWDGKSRTQDFTFKGTSKIIGAVIDPFNKIYLDANFINNSHMVQHDRNGIFYYITKAFTKTQEILQSIILFI